MIAPILAQLPSLDVGQFGFAAAIALVLLYFLRDTIKLHQQTIIALSQAQRDDMKALIEESNALKKEHTAVIVANTAAQIRLSTTVETALSIRQLEKHFADLNQQQKETNDERNNTH